MSWARRLMATGATVVLSVSLVGSGSAERAVVGGDWATWQKDPTGSRYASAEQRINARTLRNLVVKWAFAYPKTENTLVRSAPAVVGDTIYFGGSDGRFYARNAGSGAARWEFDLHSVDPAGFAIVWDGPAVSGGTVFFGDARGYFYALDASTGALRWSTRIDSHPAAMVTSSPIVYAGRVYVGVSSREDRGGREYPCCTFRGHVDALNVDTGALDWRYYTVPEPRQVGTWPSGAAKYESSGAGVWSSPVIDLPSGTLFVGTGQNFSGSGGDFDTLLALDAQTGGVRWKNQVTVADTWRGLCNDPEPEGYCPSLLDGTALDYDIGATPNIFSAGGRTMVGVGQKKGMYHAFDVGTGDVVWRRQLGVPVPLGGPAGIQWGSSFDGTRLYISTYFAGPGSLFAVNPADGTVLWQTPNPADGCTTGGAAQYPECGLANPAAASSSPGLVWEGGVDGKFRAYDSSNGQVLWTYDAVRTFTGVNGVEGMGSAFAGTGSGAVIAHGMVYVQAGYWPEYSTAKGHVLLAFGI